MIDIRQAVMSSIDVKYGLLVGAPLQAKLSLPLTVHLFGSLPNLPLNWLLHCCLLQANSMLTYWFGLFRHLKDIHYFLGCGLCKPTKGFCLWLSEICCSRMERIWFVDKCIFLVPSCLQLHLRWLHLTVKIHCELVHKWAVFQLK